MNGISKLGKLHLLRHAQTVFLSVLLPDPKQDLRQIWYPNIPNIRSHYEQVSATWHSSNLMISGMGKFYVQIGSAIANQRGIQPITVVGREDENLACTGERFKGVSLFCGIPVYLFNVIQCETNNNSESRILGSYWKSMETYGILSQFCQFCQVHPWFSALPNFGRSHTGHLQLCRRRPRRSGGLAAACRRFQAALDRPITKVYLYIYIYNIPICSMVLEYLPTCAIKITQM